MRESVFAYVSKVEKTGDIAKIPFEGSRTESLHMEADKAPTSGLVYLLVRHDDEWLLAQETYCYLHTSKEHTMPLLYKEPFLLRAMWGYAQCLLSRVTNVQKIQQKDS